MQLVHGSTFTGIGGFDLAAEWAGWENLFHCEKNEFCLRILKYYWPKADTLKDIKLANFLIYRGLVDVLSGGFPCQPYSQAGKRKGSADDRHLWPEKLRAVREIQPPWVVGENVRGITNWNAGVVFDEVQADLEAEGFKVTPFLLPAASVNAPHERYRIFFVAYSKQNHDRRQERRIAIEKESMEEFDRQKHSSTRKPCGANTDDGKGIKPNRSDDANSPGIGWIQGQPDHEAGLNNSEDPQHNGSITTNTGSSRDRQLGKGSKGKGRRTKNTEEPISWNEYSKQSDELSQFQRPDANSSGTGWSECNTSPQSSGSGYGSRFSVDNWNEWPTQPPLCHRDDGFPLKLDGITFPRWRNESIQAAGNAVVPQVVLQIFKAINKYEEMLANDRLQLALAF